jgi:hypothetical protein
MAHAAVCRSVGPPPVEPRPPAAAAPPSAEPPTSTGTAAFAPRSARVRRHRHRPSRPSREGSRKPSGKCGTQPTDNPHKMSPWRPLWRTLPLRRLSHVDGMDTPRLVLRRGTYVRGFEYAILRRTHARWRAVCSAASVASPCTRGSSCAGVSSLQHASGSRGSWCSHHLHRASRPPRALPRARLTTDRSVVTAAMVTSQAGRDEKGYQASTGDGQVRILPGGHHSAPYC